jgi:putative hydrolase of the HAD superfamily
MQDSQISRNHLDDSTNITAVILDYGQVLARSPSREEFGRMAKMFNVAFDEFYALWEGSRDTYDRGDLDAEEYWRKLAAQTNSSIKHSQIGTLREVEVEIWSHLDQGMLDWVSQLRTAGIKTGLLSNMPRDLAAHLRASGEWEKNFAFQTFSSEVRFIKPDPAIYEHTLHGLGVSAPEALFIDDREINIQAARALGIHAIQFRSIAQLKDDLEAVGFPILPTAAGSSDQSHPETKFSASL